MSTKETYLQTMKIQLDELYAGIDQLEGKTHVAEVMVMTKYQSEMHALHLQLQKALVTLEEVKAAREYTWVYLKEGMEKTFNALTDSLREFKARN